MLPISTLVIKDIMAPSTPTPVVDPPITIIVVALIEATPTLLLALVSEPTFLYEFLNVLA